MDPWVERLKARASRKETTPHSNETALHEACYSGCSLDGLKEILENHPEAIAMKDMNGLTPMHWALASKMQHEKARELIDYFYGIDSGSASNSVVGVDLNHSDHNDLNSDLDFSAAEEKQDDMNDNSSRLGHEMNHNGTNLILLKRALEQTTDLGYTALHHACLSDAPSDIIKALLSCHMQAASSHRNKKTPLHMLIEYARSKDSYLRTESIQLLLHAYPQAVHIQDKVGNTPLHYACYHETNLDAFILLLEASLRFDVLEMRNEVGQTVLHCACAANAPIPVVNALIEANPRMVLMLDIEGNTALHVACQNGTNALLKSRLLMGIWGEEALGLKNDRGQTPLQLCKDVGEIFEVIRLVPHFVGI